MKKTEEDKQSKLITPKLKGSIQNKYICFMYVCDEELVIFENFKFDNLTFFLSERSSVTFLLCKNGSIAPITFYVKE